MPEPLGATDPGSLYLLGQIDAKVTHIMVTQGTINERLEKHDARISKVERGHWKIAGIAGVAPFVLAVATAIYTFMKG
jgi:hypothetical protein